MTTEAGGKPRYAHYERQTSAGGVVYRMQDGQVEVLLCCRKEPLLWALPKGTPDGGESIRETAIREVTEETGVQVEILGKLGSVRYFFTRIQDNTRCDKTVHHYLMRPTGGDPAYHDHEFDEARWIPVEEALKMMNHPNEATMVQKAADVLAGKIRLRRLGPRRLGRAQSNLPTLPGESSTGQAGLGGANNG